MARTAANVNLYPRLGQPDSSTTTPEAKGAARASAPAQQTEPLNSPCRTPTLCGRFLGQRCAEKGCVFPAALGLGGLCLQHARQQTEPVWFGSRQPSLLLLERAKFGAVDAGSGNLNARDRRRLIRLRETFWEVV